MYGGFFMKNKCNKKDKDKFDVNEETILEEIQDGPQEEPILVPVEFEDTAEGQVIVDLASLLDEIDDEPRNGSLRPHW